MTWRPEDWISRKREACEFGPYQCEEFFEDGADAMLEALWKMAKESPTGTFTFDTREINCPSIFNVEEE